MLSTILPLVGVLVSVGVSIGIAIFGDDLRAYFRNPKVCLLLPDLEGEWTILRGGQLGTEAAIYFHALVKNTQPARLAKDLELFIESCEITDSKGAKRKEPLPCPLPIQSRRKFNGERHGMVDVGATPFAYDLVRCRASNGFEVMLNCDYPNNFKPFLRGPGTIEFVIQALGSNCASDKIAIQIEWDGVFPKEQDGLGEHVKIARAISYCD